MNQKNAFLGTEPIGRLLFRLAIPTVIAQLVNILYKRKRPAALLRGGP